MAEQEQISNLTRLADMHPPVGATLTMNTVSPVRKLAVKLLGYSVGHSVMVAAPLRKGKEIYLEKGCAVIVRFMDGCYACAFESFVIYRSVQPFSYYHLSYPYEVERIQIRQAERIATTIETWVDSDFVLTDNWPKSARITDISHSGARMESPELLGQSGHELILDFTLKVHGMAKRVHLPCEVRNTSVRTNVNGEQQHVLGLQFQEPSDDNLLVLAAYISENHHQLMTYQ